ncbi:MAG: PocR ligand-binding domain-containing protein, partial [Lentisphaeria bacterium]|nr:PocR ligand-binding domain-containing protein [Lentisphaeria bacterium]
MYFKNLSFPSGPQGFLPETLRILEELFGVVITIHDCFGQLYDVRGEHFLEQHMRHRHPFCHYLRKEQPSCNAECLKHCLFLAESHARKHDSPFLHHCWKGAEELIVPIQQNGILQFLFYVGVFRKANEAPPSRLPEEGRKLYQTLPVSNWKQLEGLEYLLKSFGSSLLQYIVDKRPETEYDRHSMLRDKIRIFLSHRIH